MICLLILPVISVNNVEIESELDYPISDIWLIKKDRKKGRSYFKVIGHKETNDNIAIVNFEDPDVQPNDFYWVAIKQKDQELVPDQNEYMAFIGPVFIDNVIELKYYS